MLVAKYLGYEAPEADEDVDSAAAEGPATAPATWLPGGQSVPATDALRNATSVEAGLAAAEAMFFGKVTHDVRKL